MNKHKETIKSGTGLLVRNYGGLFIRALRRERIWQAHREHYYQRLILSGWSHRKTAIWEYALMVACAALALAGREAAAAMQGCGRGRRHRSLRRLRRLDRQALPSPARMTLV